MNHQDDLGSVLTRETTVSMFKKAYKDLGIATLLIQSNIVKGCGIGASTIFTALLLLLESREFSIYEVTPIKLIA